jgi:hypothetical protein
LAPQRPRCEVCPDECDDEACSEEGCREEREGVAASASGKAQVEDADPAAKAGDGWVKDLANILDRLDHAETLHEDTMRFQYQYACDDLGAHLSMYREELRAALGIQPPPSSSTPGSSDG